MKLLKRDETHSSFLIGKREREMLFALLQRYPVISSIHFHSKTQPGSDDAKKNQELLEEALAEQQRENRKQLEQMLKEAGRFTENELGYTFRLTPSEIEWLLQVLNDIRVGSWIQLGEPDPKSEMSQPLNEQTMILAWTMEIAGLFQNSLLEAAHSAD